MMIKNPTAENMVGWLYSKIKKKLPELHKTRLWEGENSWVEYYEK